MTANLALSVPPSFRSKHPCEQGLDVPGQDRNCLQWVTLGALMCLV
jgi:hypothetical protein